MAQRLALTRGRRSGALDLNTTASIYLHLIRVTSLLRLLAAIIFFDTWPMRSRIASESLLARRHELTSRSDKIFRQNERDLDHTLYRVVDPTKQGAHKGFGESSSRVRFVCDSNNNGFELVWNVITVNHPKHIE